MDVAEAALAATRDQQPLLVVGHIADTLAGFQITNDGPQRNADDDVLAALAGFLPAGAGLAVFG